MKQLTLALLLLTSINAYAHTDHEHQQQPTMIEVKNAYIKPTPPGTQNTAAYFILENKSHNTTTLIDATSDSAEIIQIHEHIMSNGLMKMQHVKTGINIPSNTSIVLEPGGYHIMFIGVKNSIKEGDSVKLSLLFSDGKSINVVLPAQDQASTTAQGKHHKHNM
jgi:copper(I)-binding protein